MSFLKLAVLIMFFITLTSRTSFAANWKYLYCHNSGSNDSIELNLSIDKKVSLKTKETVFLLYQAPCQGVSNEGPYLKCYDNFGSDTRMLYSFSRLENGYIDGYSAELFNEKVLHIIFERSYQNPKGQYQQVRREFQFKFNDCIWE